MDNGWMDGWMVTYKSSFLSFPHCDLMLLLLNNPIIIHAKNLSNALSSPSVKTDSLLCLQLNVLRIGFHIVSISDQVYNAILCSESLFLYQTPGRLRVLSRILAVRSSCLLFWTEIPDVVPGICWSPQSSLGVTAPSASFTNGTAAAFTLHIFFQLFLQPLVFPELLVFLLSDGS